MQAVMLQVSGEEGKAKLKEFLDEVPTENVNTFMLNVYALCARASWLGRARLTLRQSSRWTAEQVARQGAPHFAERRGRDGGGM